MGGRIKTWRNALRPTRPVRQLPLMPACMVDMHGQCRLGAWTKSQNFDLGEGIPSLPYSNGMQEGPDHRRCTNYCTEALGRLVVVKR